MGRGLLLSWPQLFYSLTLCVTDIVDIKPANMEELTEVITAAEFHPRDCNSFVYSSSKGSIRLCDMRQRALCDQHAKCEYFLVPTNLHGEIILDYFSSIEPSVSFKYFAPFGILFCNSSYIKVNFVVFEEPEDPSSRNFFSEIISSVSDVKFSNNGRYLVTRDYLNVKVRFKFNVFHHGCKIPAFTLG